MNDAKGTGPGWEGLHETTSATVPSVTLASRLIQKSSEHCRGHLCDRAHVRQVPQHMPNKAQTPLLCLAFKATRLTPACSPRLHPEHHATHTLRCSGPLTSPSPLHSCHSSLLPVPQDLGERPPPLRSYLSSSFLGRPFLLLCCIFHIFSCTTGSTPPPN